MSRISSRVGFLFFTALILSSCRLVPKEFDANQDKPGNGGSSETASALDAATSGIEKTKNWAKGRISEAEADFSRAGMNRFPSPDFWGREIVYSIQVDRFNNGDLSNDAPPLDEGSASRIPGTRHGGDLKGIVQRLDYLKDLGITALWLTPVFKHNGSYHGYCATDPTQVDPGFGSNQDLRRLVREAHARGIKVVLDVVVNHLCDDKSSYEGTVAHSACSNDLNGINWNGGEAASLSQVRLKMSETFFPPFRRQEFFNRCGTNSGSDTGGEGAETIFGDFSPGMFDYNTRSPDFQALFTDLHKWWIAYADVDGFRLDAAKHVTEDYLAYFSTHVRDYARRLGKENFFIVGEVAADIHWSVRRVGNMETNPKNPQSHGNVPASLTQTIERLQDTYLANDKAPFPGMNAVYDFTLGGDSRGYLLQEGEGLKIEKYLTSAEHDLLARQADSRLNWVVLEIHDWPRFASHAPHDLWKSKLALSYLATVEGIPVIYYGMEQGFNGICAPGSFQAGAANPSIQDHCKGYDDSLKRQDMFVSGPWRLGSTLPAINKLAFIGLQTPALSPSWESDPMLARNHEVYQTSRRFNRLRSSCSPLNKGRTAFRWHSNGVDGIFAFSRIDGEKEMLVVVNNTSGPLAIPDLALDRSQQGVYRNAVNEAQSAEADGKLLRFKGLQLDGNSVAVFAPEAALGEFDRTLGVRLCKE